MTVLKPKEYDISYFDGDKSEKTHEAGYSTYVRQFGNPKKDSLGEFWLDVAADLAFKYQLQGKTVLELGCAKGFIVKSLRDLGVNAYGIDISEYAVGQCETEVASFIQVADVLTHLQNLPSGSFDWIISRDFLNCFTDTQIKKMIPEMNRVAVSQVHLETLKGNVKYYNMKANWDYLNFKKGTQIIVN